MKDIKRKETKDTQTPPAKKRVLWLDMAKAAGILVVLLVHTGKSLGPVTFYGGMFYMPVFFVLAGMTFSYRAKENFLLFLKKKAKRLLLPYFGYNLFLFAFFFLKGAAAGEISRASFFPLLGILYSRNCLLPMDAATNVYFMQILNAPTWFLTGMFVSYALFWLLLRAAKGDLKKAGYLNFLFLFGAVLLHYLCPVLLPWSIDCALYAVSFLLLGKMAAEQKLAERFCEKPLLIAAAAVVFVLFSHINGSVNMSVGDYGRSMMLYLIVGFLGSLLVLIFSRLLEQARVLRPVSEALGFLGRHTLPVLCLHLFVYSAVGTVMGMLGSWG